MVVKYFVYGAKKERNSKEECLVYFIIATALEEKKENPEDQGIGIYSSYT